MFTLARKNGGRGYVVVVSMRALLQRSDVVVGIVCLLISVAGVVVTWLTVPQADRTSGDPGPAVFPYVILILIAVLSVLLVVQGYRDRVPRRRNSVEGSEFGRSGTWKSSRLARFVLCLLLFAVYMAGVVVLGFYVGCVVFLLLAYRILNVGGPVKVIVLSLVSPAVVVYIFQMILHMPLPEGPLGWVLA